MDTSLQFTGRFTTGATATDSSTCRAINSQEIFIYGKPKIQQDNKSRADIGRKNMHAHLDEMLNIWSTKFYTKNSSARNIFVWNKSARD